MSLLRNEDGVTIIELLTSLLIGTVVLLGLFQLVDVALPATNRVMDRVDTQQRGRVALEELVRALRNATCVPTSTTAGGARVYQTPLDTDPTKTNATKITFYPAVLDRTDPLTFRPAKREVELVGTELRERDYALTWPPSGPAGALTYSWAATSTARRTLLQGVEPSAAIFTYYAYDMAGTLQPVTAAADLARAVKVSVSLKINPVRAGAIQTGQSTTVSDEVTFRVPVDFSTATTTYKGPACTG